MLGCKRKKIFFEISKLEYGYKIITTCNEENDPNNYLRGLLEWDQIFVTYSAQAQNVHKCLVCMTVKWSDQTK